MGARVGERVSWYQEPNAGSEANHGVLRGYLIDVSADGVERTLRVEG